MGWFAPFVAHLVLPALGAGLAWHPGLRRGPVTVRLSAAFLAGAVAVTVEAMLWSLLGLRWTVARLTLPALALSSGLAWVWSRRPAAAWRRGRCRPAVAVTGLALIAGGVAQLALAAITGRATSADLVLFWGVKATHWARSGGLDAAALAGPFAIHTHPSYPPLYPIVLALGALTAGDLPWLAVPAASVLWVVATVPVMFHLLEQRVHREQALAVTAFWTVAVTSALVAACSAGNAEPPLLAYTTVALVAVVVGGEEEDRRFSALAALAAAGAVLTKNEGAIAIGLIVAGFLLRTLWSTGRRAMRSAVELVAGGAVSFVTWLVVRLALGLPLTDPIRERAFAVSFDQVGTILATMTASLGAGTRGLAWLVPAAVLVLVARNRLVEVLPALTLVVGLFAFLGFYYLHAAGDPSRLIGWTLPRVTIPALSALVLAAGLAAASPPATGREGELKPDR